MIKVTLKIECDKCGEVHSDMTFVAYTYVIGSHMEALRQRAEQDGWVSRLTDPHSMSDTCPDCYAQELGGP